MQATLSAINIIIKQMTTQCLSINSRRQYIKQKTNEIVQYPYFNPKRSAKAFKKCAPIQNDHDHDTSIALQSSKNIQQPLSSQASSHIFQMKSNRCFNSMENLGKRINRKKSNERKPNSVNCINKQSLISKRYRSHGSIAKKSLNGQSEKSGNYGSSQSLENQLPKQPISKVEKKTKINSFNPLKIRSENNLKSTLKKSSCSRLKIKVKDPFERKMKLENQFNNQSDVMKEQQSMLSTVNQDEFREILSHLQL